MMMFGEEKSFVGKTYFYDMCISMPGGGLEIFYFCVKCNVLYFNKTFIFRIHTKIYVMS